MIPAVAKKYMLAAKQQDPSLPIDANGKWTGGEKILTIATNADPGKKTAEVFQGQIEQLGFKLNFRIVPQDTLYTKFCGVPKAKVAICPNVGLVQGLRRPAVDARRRRSTATTSSQQGNVNWPQLNVPAINDAMKAGGVGPGRAPSATRRGPRSTT